MVLLIVKVWESRDSYTQRCHKCSASVLSRLDLHYLQLSSPYFLKVVLDHPFPLTCPILIPVSDLDCWPNFPVRRNSCFAGNLTAHYYCLGADLAAERFRPILPPGIFQPPTQSPRRVYIFSPIDLCPCHGICKAGTLIKRAPNISRHPQLERYPNQSLSQPVAAHGPT